MGETVALGIDGLSAPATDKGMGHVSTSNVKKFA